MGLNLLISKHRDGLISSGSQYLSTGKKQKDLKQKPGPENKSLVLSSFMLCTDYGESRLKPVMKEKSVSILTRSSVRSVVKAFQTFRIPS